MSIDEAIDKFEKMAACVRHSQELVMGKSTQQQNEVFNSHYELFMLGANALRFQKENSAAK